MRPECLMEYRLREAGEPLPWAVGAADAELAWRPVPSPDGALHQDPDFSLPSTAGPVAWQLHYASRQASESGVWGYGRRSSLDLTLTTVTQDSDTIVRVAHEDGTYAVYRSTGGSYEPEPGTVGSLTLNGDGSWDETRGDSGFVYRFDSAGKLQKRETPWARVLTFLYDGSDRLESVVEPAGRRLTLTYNVGGHVEALEDWGGRRTTLTYSGAGDLTEEQGPSGCITEYDYDGAHRLVGITDPEAYSTTYTWDAIDRVASRSVAGNRTEYTHTYDAQGRLQNTVKDPLGRLTTVTVDLNGQVVESVDPLGNRGSFTYAANRMTAEKDALDRIWTYAYDTAGNRTRAQDALGQMTTWSYDASNNLLTEQNALGQVTSYGYGANPERRQPVTVMNAVGAITTFGYVDWGAREFVEDPLGYRDTWVWNNRGELEARIDANGNRRSFEYDRVGNALCEIDPLGRRWSASYDAMGRQTARQNPLGAVWTTIYDARGGVIAEIDPLGSRTSMTWNAANQLTCRINPLGHRTTHSYDAASQLCVFACCIRESSSK